MWQPVGRKQDSFAGGWAGWERVCRLLALLTGWRCDPGPQGSQRNEPGVTLLDFPGGPVAKIPPSQCRAPGSIPGWGVRHHVWQLRSCRLRLRPGAARLIDKMKNIILWACLVAQMVKTLPAMWQTWVQSLGQEDPLEKEMATHSSVLTWRIPRTEEPGGL